MKKWGLFDDVDLFFMERLKPLKDKTKLIKFKGSYLLMGTLIFCALSIPYQ